MRRDRFDFLEITETPQAPAEEELLLPSVDDLPSQSARPTARYHATGGRLALLETIGEAGQEIGRFSSPSGLCVDGANNLYVADTMRHRIQKITPQDEAYGYGGVGEGAGQFRMPSDVVVDPRSFIYVLEMGNHRITKLTQDGTYMCSIGGPGDGFGRFRSPEAVCMDRFNNLLVADTGNHLVQLLDARGRFIRQLAFECVGRLRSPRGIWSGPDGEIIVADTGNGRLVHADSSGAVTGIFRGVEQCPLRAPVSACRDGDHSIWVVDAEHHAILKFAVDGALLARVGPMLGPNGNLYSPSGMVFAPDGDFYVADTGNHRLLRFGYRSARNRRAG